MPKNVNVYILGNLTDELTGDALDRELEKYREAENQLACFGFGVLSPHHLPADLRGKRGVTIRMAMMRTADFAYMIEQASFTSPEANLFSKVGSYIHLPGALYDRFGHLRSMLGVETPVTGVLS